MWRCGWDADRSMLRQPGDAHFWHIHIHIHIHIHNIYIYMYMCGIYIYIYTQYLSIYLSIYLWPTGTSQSIRVRVLSLDASTVGYRKHTVAVLFEHVATRRTASHLSVCCIATLRDIKLCRLLKYLFYSYNLLDKEGDAILTSYSRRQVYSHLASCLFNATHGDKGDNYCMSQGASM